MSIAYLTTQAVRRAASAFALAAVATVAACGGSSSAGTTDPVPPIPQGPPAATATVAATPSLAFTPNTVTIAVGGTVTMDFGSVPHNVFFDNAPAGAPANITAATSDKSMTLTFNQAGTFEYNCHIHPGMRGTVVVK
jgi:plastocyanin